MRPEHAVLLIQALILRVQQDAQIHGKLRRVGVSIGGPGEPDKDITAAIAELEQTLE